MIELKHIHAARNGEKIFKNLSWRISEGEHWLITGPSGSGKSRLLDIIAGNLHITAGAIEIDFIDGKDWDERYRQRKEKIHMVPAHAIQNLMRNREAQYYQQRYYDIGDERTPSVRDILGPAAARLHELSLPESLSIDSLLDLDITRLSNGQLKKVLLIRILLAGTPRVLLLDYPFEGLDARSREELCNLIDFIASAYRTSIILVDHHHQLPQCLTHELELINCNVARQGVILQPVINTTTIGTHISHSSDAEPVVEIRNLQIRYGEKIILENFNWLVRRGERWALVGRNGAGKTTLFSMIFADHPMAYSQQIYLFGKRRGSGESIWDIKKRIAYLGPELMSYLPPDQMTLTARAYLKMTIRPFNEEMLNKVTAGLRTAPLLDRPLRMLSSGQLQMVLIMSCLMKPAEILLLDEPFQFLDRDQKKNFRSYLHTHLNIGQTLILITHYEEDLREWTAHTKRL